MGRTVAVVVIFLYALSTASLWADDGPSFAAGQTYLDKLAVDVKDRAPFEELVGIYHGRKWVSHSRIQASRAAAESGGLLQLIIRTEARIEGHIIEDSSTQVLGPGWRPIRIECRTLRDGVQASSMTMTVDGGRWKGKVLAGGKGGEIEGELVPGSCFAPIYLPWLMAPDREMKLTTPTQRPAPCEFTCPESPHRARFGDKAVEWRRVRLISGGREHQLLIDALERCVEMRSFDGVVVRPRRISKEEIGDDLEGPLDLTESQEIVIRLLDAMQRQDVGAIEGLVDFEAGIRAEIRGWEAQSEEFRRDAVEKYKKSVMEAFLKAGATPTSPDDPPVPEFVAANSLAVESGDSAEVWVGRLRFRLLRREAPSGRSGWAVVKLVRAKEAR